MNIIATVAVNGNVDVNNFIIFSKTALHNVHCFEDGRNCMN
jgi:hypothetical protein